MSVATITPAATPAVKGKGKPTPAATVATATADAMEATIKAIRARWELADKSEADTRKLFEAADIAWQNARVVKTRVAYCAAMVSPVKGAANLLNAARILLTDEADTPAKRTAAAKSRKNTLRNYVAAGEALQEAGLANRTAEPDEEERKIVANVFREMNKRDKADDAADAKGEGEGEGEGNESDTPADDESVTYVDLVAHVSQMNNILKMLKAGSVPVSEREASNMADMLAGFQMELDAYSAGV